MTGVGSSSRQVTETRSVEAAHVHEPHEGGLTTGPIHVGPGTTLDRYVLLRELGQGARGAVYAAYDPELDRKVAIKRLLTAGWPPRAEEGGRAVARFHREARSLAKLSHPNVVQVYEVGEHDGIPHIVMELVDGMSLRAWAYGRLRSWQEIIAVLLDAGRGLGAAHEAGLLHRDFKPDNVLVGNDGRVRVADFGLAKRTAEWIDVRDPEVAGIPTAESSPSAVLRDPLTVHGAVVGTVPYMAPEQYHARAPMDASVDQYAFCVTAWELLNNERPFHGRRKAMLEDKRHGPPAWPPDSRVPRHVVEAVCRGLAASPKQRWPSMQALLEAMRPRPPRRWWALGLAIALVGGGALAGRAVGVADDECEDAQARIEQVWNADAAAAVQEALLGTGLSYAPTTWSLVQARLDGYTAQWSTMHAEACESEHALHLRMACLEQQREVVRATVEVLREGDTQTVEQAIDLVDELPSLERCANVAALEARVPLPEDPAVAAEIQQLRTRLVQAGVQSRAGRFEAALATLEALDERAHALEYGPFTAEVAFELGLTLEALGRTRPAMGQLETAYVAALEHGDDELAAQAAARMARTVVEVLADPQVGITWATSALALVRRRHRGEALEGQMLSVAGDVLAAAGDTTRAVVWQQAAVDLLQARPETLDSELAVALNGLGIALNEHGRFDEALPVMQQSLLHVERAYGSDHPRMIDERTNVGIMLLELGRHAEAVAMLEQALAQAEATWPSGHPQLVFAFNALGVAHMKAGDADAALVPLRRSLAIAEEVYGPGNLQVFNAMINIAGVLQMQGEHDEGIVMVRRTIELAEATLGPRHGEVAEHHVALGSLLASAEHIDEARLAYEHALEIQRDVLVPPHPALATSLVSLGGLLVEQGAHVEAEALLREALANYLASVGDRHHWVRRVRLELAKALEGQGRHDEARVQAWRAVAPSDDPEAAQYVEGAQQWLAEHPEPPTGAKR
jgi:tetratricopeptide (TPR) repeat protein/tRNA A-37 threonylcarbamoyl transferase component Bud32